MCILLSSSSSSGLFREHVSISPIDRAHHAALPIDLHLYNMFRSSARARLSLGDSMLRSVHANMDPTAMTKIMEVRHEEHVALQVRTHTLQRYGM